MLLFFMAYGCNVELPTQPMYIAEDGIGVMKEKTFQAAYDEVWSAVVNSAASIEWQTEFLASESGVIKFKTAYFYSDALGSQLFTIYHYPKKYEAQYSNVDGYVRSWFYSPQGQIPNGNVFIQGTMYWKIKSLDQNKTKVTIELNLIPFNYLTGFLSGAKSNGVSEFYYLNHIDDSLRHK